MDTLRNSITVAAELLRTEGVVALPTEGVYGLSCIPTNLASIRRLCSLKARPEDKGFVLVAASLAQLQDYILPLSAQHLAMVAPTWPGPITWIVPAKADVPRLVRGDVPSIAVRVTAHPILQAVCAASGGPIISTSANKHGQSPALSAQQVQQLFATNDIDYILDGPLGNLKGPTEIRDLQTCAIIRPFS